MSERERVPTRGLAGVATRTVGREVELAVLQSAYQSARAGEGVQWVTVSGAAGVGKSRLLAEFESWLGSRPEKIRYLKGRARPQTTRSPHFLLRDLLSSCFQIRDGDSLAVARDKLTVGLTEVLGDRLGEEAAAFIGQLVGFDFGYSRWIFYIVEDSRQIRDRAVVLLQSYLARLCADQPTVLLLEDLHWADEESMTLLSGILSRPQPGLLCAVGMARPLFWERDVRWGQSATGESVAHHRRMDLAPLSRAQAAELARELLQKVAQSPDWLVELLVEHGAGNPYFTEELVLWLVEREVIETGPDAQGPWQVRQEPSPRLSVPGTVQGVLRARLERLSRAEQATLQGAAVVGRVFWDGALAYVGQKEVPAEQWERLQRRDLVLWQPASQLPGEEYHFKHALLHDIVYERTPKQLRRLFHRRAAEWLVQVAAERAAEWAAVIATHYERAEEAVAAAEWYGQAGKQTQATYAPGAATDYYQKALALLPPEAEHAARRVELYEGLGRVLRWQARYAEAAEAYTAMGTAAEALRNGAAQARAWERLSDVQDSRGDHYAALRSAEFAERIARAVGAQVELAMALFGKGWAFMRLGNAETALTLAEDALALSTALAPRARHVVARSQNLLGIAYKMLGRYEQAVRYQEMALASFRELGDRRRVGGMLNNLGETARLRGDYRTAVALYQEALAIAHEIGDQDWEMAFLSNLGGARVGLGEFRAAEADLRQVINMAQTTGWLALSETYCFLAEACLGQGKTDQALTAAHRALALGQEMGQQMFLGAIWRVLGRLAAGSSAPIVIGDDAYDAAACFAQSLRIFAHMGAEGERAWTLREWARYELERGARERGAEMWQRARDIFERLGMQGGRTG